VDADAASSELGRASRGGPGEDVLFAGHGARHLESIKAKADFVDAACYVVAAHPEESFIAGGGDAVRVLRLRCSGGQR
jgi:hypothetical protein